MCEALEELFAGRLETQRRLGIQEGVSLINKLLNSNRIDDAKRATEDPAYLNALMAEFKL